MTEKTEFCRGDIVTKDGKKPYGFMMGTYKDDPEYAFIVNSEGEPLPRIKLSALKIYARMTTGRPVMNIGGK